MRMDACIHMDNHAMIGRLYAQQGAAGSWLECTQWSEVGRIEPQLRIT